MMPPSIDTPEFWIIVFVGASAVLGLAHLALSALILLCGGKRK